MSFFSHLGDVVSNVLNNPLPAIEDVGLISMGVDPVTAGAITGGTNAAVNNTNILTGALTGAASGYVGGAASDYLGGAGAGTTLASAGGGAASGATGALLSGQNPITGAFTGALAGSVISQIPMQNGGVTYTFDDGSSLQYAANGSIIGGTDSTGAAIPQSAITAANQAPVSQATPVSPADAQNITSMVQNLQASNTAPAEAARILQAQGYSADQVISALGPDSANAVNSAYSALATDNTNISNTVKQMQAADPTVSPAAVAKALQAQGYTAEDAIGALGSNNADLINQAFSDATAATTTAAANATAGLSNEDADNISNTVKTMQANGSSATEIAQALSQQGYTADQVIAVTGDPTAVNAAYASLNSTGVVTGVNTATGTLTQTQLNTGTNTNFNTSNNNGTNTGSTGGSTGSTGGSTGSTGGSGGGAVVPVIPNGSGTTATTATTSSGPAMQYQNGPNETSPFTNGLINPGLNPGQVQIAPAYNTTNPAQASYYWGQHPYELNANDIGTENNIPTAPATPWGLQNFQEPTGYSNTGQPIYAPASAPATKVASGPQTVEQQLDAAWQAGNYGAVQNLVNQNNITTTQANQLWGPATTQAASANGIKLIQPVLPTAMTPSAFTTPATSVAPATT